MKQLNKIILILVLFNSIHSFGQSKNEIVEGVVTYKSSQHVYVKFKTTEFIEIGDTLLLKRADKIIPALIVKNKSSVSCVCSLINGKSVVLEEKIYFNPSKASNHIPEIPLKQEVKTEESPIISDTVVSPKTNGVKKELVSGKIAIASYSNLSNTELDNSQRMRYTLSLNTIDFASKRLRAETYISFKHKVGEWNEVNKNIYSALKIYKLALNYKMSDKMRLSVGRKINPLMSNVGAIDGLQLQAKIQDLKIGLIAGTRPDHADYSFNTDLPQLGAYIAHEHKSKSGYMRNSFAVMEQRNGTSIDRRFAYFQHQNQLLKQLYLFSSFELDLYKKKQEVSSNEISLTGLYVFVRYRPGKKYSMSLSYDARKQVVYYETYKSYLDQLLDQETRQGFRFRINYKPWKKVSIGLNAGYRFKKDDPVASKNLHSYINLRNVLGNSISTTISATHIESSYFNSTFYGLRMYKELYQGKIQLGLSYRYIDYYYLSSEENILQNTGELSINWRIRKKLSLSANYEYIRQGTTQFSRVYLQLRQRF